MENKDAVARNPYKCMVGCSTCATICPVNAVSFPSRDMVQKLERQYKIFRTVRREATEKRNRFESLRARASAEEKISRLITKAHFEVAGTFGEKKFLVKLGDLIKNQPYDFINLLLETPTVKGAMENTPSFLTFDLTSTRQENIQDFIPKLRALILDEGFVLVSEKLV